MSTITDAFGRTVTKTSINAQTTYSVPLQDGIFTVTQEGDGDDGAALTTINAMGSPPAPDTRQAVPDVVTLWKAKAVLAAQPSKLHPGKTLLDDATAVIAAAPQMVQIAWANAADLERTSATLGLLASEIGLTSSDLDTLFVAADAFVLP